MSELVPKKGAERLPNQGELVEVGQWYWVNRKGKPDLFCCVVQVGSNFAEFEDPYGNNERVHLNEFDKRCRPELDPEKVIREHQVHFKGIVREKLGEIKDLTAKLGLSTQQVLSYQEPSESRALSVLSGTANIDHYKKALIKAKEKDLPALFEEVKKANENLVIWMKAQALPMEAMAEGMKGVVEVIDDRVFNVSLYAGLTEEVEQVSKGEAAPATEKLRVLQRLLYMDEECLLNYRHGGMDIKKLPQFDKWLAKPENRDRALPFPRCVVAFRVRRNQKERDWGGSLKQAFIDIELGELDKLTFLYMRNGENLFRMNCSLDFGELIFPGKHEVDLSEPMMAKMWGDSVENLVPKRAYDDMLKEYKENVRKYEEWNKQNPKKSWVENPWASDGWSGGSKGLDRYQPFNPSSVYYDEIKKTIEKRIQYFNRVALIIQGLFDRSPVFHPHPPVKLWTPEGFEAAVELVYDGSDLLHYGEAPNFEAYREACNASLDKDSVTVGQDQFWAEKEAHKENERLRNDWRTKSDYQHTTFRPYGNPGPGYLARIVEWSPRKRRATYKWIRERRTATWEHNYGDPVNSMLIVPALRLFNVSAYKAGDYKKFFVDPRTRMNYLQWAPMLIAAEEYLAGNLKLEDMAKENA